MSKRVFKLDDFDSRACDIELRGKDEKPLILSLRKFTLMDRIWAEKEFGSLSKWESTIFPQSEKYSEAAWLEGLLKTIHRLIETPKTFDTWEDLATELECTLEVLLGLQKALLYVLQGSEPLIEKLDDEVKKNLEMEAPKKKKKKKARKTGRK